MRSAFLLSALLFTACVPGRGVVSQSGYWNAEYSYSVMGLGDELLMPEGWYLENFYADERGRAEKTAPAYRTTFNFDTDEDGTFETKVETALFDLRFEHRVHDGVVVLRTIPLSSYDSTKRLDVLLDRYIENFATAGYAAFETNSGGRVVLERRYAAKLIGQQSVKVAGLDGLAADVELANLDQLKVDPNAFSDRMKIVIFHTPLLHPLKKGVRNKVDAPVLMMAIYSNRPKNFDEGLKDFDGLLGRIRINETKGYSLVVETPKPESPPAATETSSVAVPPTKNDPSAAETPASASSAPPASPAAPPVVKP